MDEAMECQTCGQNLPLGSTFCGQCGQRQLPTAAAPGLLAVGDDDVVAEAVTTEPVMPAMVLPPPPLDATAQDAPAGRQIPRSTLWLVPLVAVALVAGFIGLALKNHNTTNHLRQERTHLARTEHALSKTRQDLSRSEESLSSTKADLTIAASDLTATKKQRDDAKAELLWANTQLEGVRNTLGNATTQIDGQSELINSLRTCLSGVLSALQDATYSDYSSAVAELEAVEADCQAANDAL